MGRSHDDDHDGDRKHLLEDTATPPLPPPSPSHSVSFWLSCLALPFVFTFTPSSSFLVSFLTRFFNLDTIDDVILPLWSYSFLACSLAFGLISAYAARAPLIAGLFGGLAGTLLASVLPAAFPSHALALVIASEVATGAFSAGEVMYSSLLYNLVADPGQYQRLASYSRAMRLLGVLSSSLLAQLLLLPQVATPRIVLFYISAGAMALALAMAYALPFRNSSSSSAASLSNVPATLRATYALLCRAPVQRLVAFLLVCNAVHPLVLTYWQSLFLSLDGTAADSNAYLFAGCNTLAFCATFVPLALGVRAARATPALLWAAPPAAAALLLCMSAVLWPALVSIWPSYVAFALYHATFELMLVMANAALARHIAASASDSGSSSGDKEATHELVAPTVAAPPAQTVAVAPRGVLFGLTYGGAVALQVALQAALQAAGLPVRALFAVLAAAHLITPLALAVIGVTHGVT